MGVLAAIRAAMLVRRSTRQRNAGDVAGARATAARAATLRPAASGPAIAGTLAALAQGDLDGAAAALDACTGAPNRAVGLLRAVIALDRGDRAAARAALGADDGNRVRAAYRALATGDPVKGAWPTGLAGEIPAASHLRARVLEAAELRLAARQAPDAWTQAYLDVLFDVREPVTPGEAAAPGTSLADAFTLFDAGQYAAALATLDALGDLAAAERTLYRGACCLRLGRLDEAAAELTKAAGARPKDYFPVLLQGGTALLAGNDELARTHFQRALDLFPVAGELCYHIGLAALRCGDAVAARAAFGRLAGLDDVFFQARIRAAAGVGA